MTAGTKSKHRSGNYVKNDSTYLSTIWRDAFILTIFGSCREAAQIRHLQTSANRPLWSPTACTHRTVRQAGWAGTINRRQTTAPNKHCYGCPICHDTLTPPRCSLHMYQTKHVPLASKVPNVVKYCTRYALQQLPEDIQQGLAVEL
jgi:hypothetical protein